MLQLIDVKVLLFVDSTVNRLSQLIPLGKYRKHHSIVPYDGT